jgi:hypothetical protein
MAEYGNNHDYGESPFYKDDEVPGGAGGDTGVLLSNATTDTGIILLP